MLVFYASQRPAPNCALTACAQFDRLGFTLFIAALIHIAVIVGVGFSLNEPKPISRTLEITLSTFKSETAPKKGRLPGAGQSRRQWHAGQKSGAQDHRSRAVPGHHG